VRHACEDTQPRLGTFLISLDFQRSVHNPSVSFATQIQSRPWCVRDWQPVPGLLVGKPNRHQEIRGAEILIV